MTFPENQYEPERMASPAAYQDWARLIEPVQDRDAQFLELIVFRIRADDAETYRTARFRLMELVERGFLLLEAHERSIVLRDEPYPKEDDPRSLRREIYHAYRQIGAVIEDFDKLFEVLDIGAPILLSDEIRGRTLDVPERSKEKTKAPTPIVAVIDDGIGFLNRRFRKADGTSRVHALWLQSLTTIPIPPLGGFFVYSGLALYKPQIDGLLAAGSQLDETRVYKALNGAIVKPREHRSTEFSYSHGTHIMDVAAGADPGTGDATEDWPILAVQLPPEAVNNTAGTQLEPSITQAVRWILKEAEALSDDSPLIINISFGTLAGPKDGTKLIERLIADDVADWETRTKRCARVVYAFGNDRQRQGVARFCFDPCNREDSLTWRIQPDNAASSLVEIRSEPSTSLVDLELSLRAPSGAALTGLTLPPFSFVNLLGAGGLLARIYHIGALPLAGGAQTQAYYLIAVPPTKDTSFVRSEHGAWEIGFASRSASDLAVRAEVQRGDTPVGYRLFGRQSYFDHPDAYKWDEDRADYSRHAASGPITTQGTHSSFVTAGTRQTYSASAFKGIFFDQAPYSSEGAPWTIPDPTVAALGDDFPDGRGVVASGTFSGSGRTSQGSSVSAARLTNALAQQFAKNGCCTTRSKATEVNDLVAAMGQTVVGKAPVHSRGAGVLTHAAGGRAPR